MQTATTGLIGLRQIKSGGIVFFNFLLLGLQFVFRLKESLVSWNSNELIMCMIKIFRGGEGG